MFAALVECSCDAPVNAVSLQVAALPAPAGDGAVYPDVEDQGDIELNHFSHQIQDIHQSLRRVLKRRRKIRLTRSRAVV